MSLPAGAVLFLTPVRPWRTALAGPSFTTGAAFAAMPCSALFLPRTFPAPYGLGVRSFFAADVPCALRAWSLLFCRGRSLRPAGLESAFLPRTFPAPCGLGVCFFAADVPCALRAWSPLFCRGRSLRPTGLESALFLPRTFPAPYGLGVRFRGPQSRPLYQPIKRVVDSGRWYKYQLARA